MRSSTVSWGSSAHDWTSRETSLRPPGVVATTLRLICWSSIVRPITGRKPIRFQGFMIEDVRGRWARSRNAGGRPNSAAPLEGQDHDDFVDMGRLRPAPESPAQLLVEYVTGQISGVFMMLELVGVVSNPLSVQVT